MYAHVEEFLRQVKIKQAAEPTLLDNEVMVNRYNHMFEELSEFAQSNNMSDLHGCVDALVDLVYVALGTASMMGLNEDHWQDCFDRVHEANMTKKHGPVEGHKFGVVKPDNFKAPNFKGILPEENEYPIEGEL